MSRTHRFLIALVLATLALCGCEKKTTPATTTADTTETPRPADTGDKKAAPTGPSMLFLLHAPGDKKSNTIGETRLVEVRGEEVETLGTRKGMLAISPGGRLWSWQQESQEVVMETCMIGDEPTTKKTEKLEVPWMIEIGGSARIRLDEPVEPGAKEPISYFEYGAQTPRLLGSWLLMETSGYSECGAHPSSWSELVIFDLESGELVDPRKDEELRASLADERKRAFPKFEEELRSFDSPDDLELTELFPSYDEAGELTVIAQLTGGTAYVTHDGSWGSYSLSRKVPVKGLPEPLVPAKTLPEELRPLFTELDLPVDKELYVDHTRVEATPELREKLMAAFSTK